MKITLLGAAGGEVTGSSTAQVCQKAVESQAIAKRPGPFLVLAGAGMCTGGRILNHLQNHSVIQRRSC